MAAPTAYVKLRALNQDLIADVEVTALTDEALDGGSTLTVEEIEGFGVGDYVLIGEFGQEKSEIIRIHTSTAPSNKTITLNANLVSDHAKGTKVYRIDHDQVEFSRATTLTGSKSVLATVDIDADSLYTVYEDVTNTTGFGFYRWANSGDSSFSNYSESTPYAGYDEDTVKRVFDDVLRQLGNTDSQGRPTFTHKITRDACFDALRSVEQMIQHSRQRWSYLLSDDVSLGTITVGDDRYDITAANVAHKNGKKSILTARVGTDEPLAYIDKETFQKRREDVTDTTLNGAISSTSDVTIVLTDSSNFPDSGVIYIVNDDGEDFDTVSFTGNTRSTNTLTGVTNISETHADGAIVWTGIKPGTPAKFTVIDGDLLLDPPPGTNYDGKEVTVDAYVDATVVDDLADTINFPAFVVKPGLLWMLGKIRYDSDADRVAGLKTDFQEQLTILITNEDDGQQIKMRPSRAVRTPQGVLT